MRIELDQNLRPSLWHLYEQMLRSRLFEKSVMGLWQKGLISGEMHMGIGEEAIAAGIVTQLQEGDAMALDHRGTPPLVIRGIDLYLILRELLGRPDGLCRGMGGHMHIFSRDHLAASSGIIGASGPAAAGFALAAQYLRPGTLAVAFFGEGAVNQGMLLESMNLAVVWKLPVLFVCKDDGWSQLTVSSSVTGGSLTDRAKSFGMPAREADGFDVESVWRAANEAISRARRGGGPTFLHARCVHFEGHFLGDPFLRISRHPLREARKTAGPLLGASFFLEGSPRRKRIGRLIKIGGLIRKGSVERQEDQADPVVRTRKMLAAEKYRLRKLEAEVHREIEDAVSAAIKDFSVITRERP